MSFASSQTLRSILPSCVDPFSINNVKHGAYELTLGEEVVSTNKKSLKRLSGPDRGNKLGESFVIKPGQSAMLMTSETIKMPFDKLGFISIKAGIKLSGLINISGFHVDPGFEGKLKFTVYNAGASPVILRRCQNIFMLWLADIDRAVDDPYNNNDVHYNQTQLSDKDLGKFDGILPSPLELSKKIDRVNVELRLMWVVVGGMVVALATGRMMGCGV